MARRIVTPARVQQRNEQTMRGRGRAGTIETASYRCEKHAITYEIPSTDRPTCPMCLLDSEHTDLQIAYQRINNRVETLEQENGRLRDELSDVVAMRHASDLLDEGDLTFLKDVLYRWREVRGARLSTIMVGDELRGFLMDPEGGNPETRVMTSIGGVTLVYLFRDAASARGNDHAMGQLARALSRHLTGGAT